MPTFGGQHARGSVLIHGLLGLEVRGDWLKTNRQRDRHPIADAALNATRAVRRGSDLPVDGDERVVVETPGAGGYGEPSERPADLVEVDRASQKFSPDFLAKHYD